MKSFLEENKFSLTFITLAILILDLFFYWNTLEDSQITFRYSLRLYEGYGYGMWNRTGNPVEGFTTTMWMLYLSLFGSSLDTMTHAAKITSISLHAATAWFFLFLSHKHKNGDLIINMFPGNEGAAAEAFKMTSLGLAMLLPLSWYATTGMETVLFMTMVVLSLFLPLVVRNTVLIVVANVVLLLTRPDGFLFAFAISLFYFLCTKDKKFIATLLATCVALAALTTFRYFYFGYVLPNTYYAKSSNPIPHLHYVNGIKYIASFAASNFLIFVPIVIFIFRLGIRPTAHQLIKHRGFIAMMAGVVAYLLLIAKAGGDNYSAFPMWRHGLQVFPLILFACFYALNSLNLRSKAIQYVTLAYLFLAPVLFTVPSTQAAFLREQIKKSVDNRYALTNYAHGTEFFVWMRNVFGKDAVIATPLAGALPLHVDAVHIDTLGLNDEYIAHHGTFDSKGPVDSKTDMAYVVSLEPDVIEGYMQASKILNGNFHSEIKRRLKMNLELINDPKFQSDYVIIKNAPYQYFDRILFVKKAYLQQISKSGIKTIALDQLIVAAGEFEKPAPVSAPTKATGN